MKHPPPWTVTVDPQDGWFVLRFANGETVFATSDKELIEQIVLACNSHETLVAACRKFLDVWKRAGPLGSHQFEKFDVVVTMTEAALALAEPQTERPAGALDDVRTPPAFLTTLADRKEFQK